MALQLTLLVPLAGVLCQLVTEAGSCAPENAPTFQDRFPGNELPGPVYAIIPAYTFPCHGSITLWGACVQPGESDSDRYDILFQVFRPRPSDGVECYDLIGENVLNDGVPGVTGEANIDSCMALTSIPPEDQIQVQPGDVVGFYAVHNRNGDQGDGGVQMNMDITSVIVWNTEILVIADPHVCPYRIGGNLASSSAGAPVIFAHVVTITPQANPTPSSLSSPSHPGQAHLDTPSTRSHTTIQPSRSTQPVPTSTNQPVPESTNKSSSQNLIIYGAIGGVIGLILIVTTVCVIVIFKKKRGVANTSLQDNIHTKGNEAYSTHLTSLAIPTSQNEAYGAVQSAHTDEGYVINQLVYEDPSAVEARRNNTPVIPTAQNEAYGAVGSGGEEFEYDYVLT